MVKFMFLNTYIFENGILVKKSKANPVTGHGGL
jgi:hypothetical protein